MEGINNIFEKKICNLLLYICVLRLKLYCWAEFFFDAFTILQLTIKNIYIGLSILEITCFDAKIFLNNRTDVNFYAMSIYAFDYRQMHLNLKIHKDIFYLGIIFFKSFAIIYLPTTKFVLQAKKQTLVYLKLHCCF